MGKTLFVRLAMACMVCSLILAVGCTKPKVKPDSGEMETMETNLQDEESESQARQMEEQMKAEMEEARAIQAEEAKAQEMFEQEMIHFEFDKSAITPQAQKVLSRKAIWLRNHPDVSITIEGHCDERGTVEYNMALGQRRAQSAKEFLVDMGISASRLDTISFGEEQPLDPASNPAAWAKNRRAEFVIQ